jgi:mono/diheme cytochrome c family protein
LQFPRDGAPAPGGASLEEGWIMRFRLAVGMLTLLPAVGVPTSLPLAAAGQTLPKRPAASKKGGEDPLEIPAAARDRQNPFSRSPETLRLGRALWQNHCETCHGTEGRGDGPNARLHERRKGHAPRNLTDPNVQENLTDGELFFRITKGIIEGDSIIMPSFEQKVPAESERWQIVLFVRELGQAALRK